MTHLKVISLTFLFITSQIAFAAENIPPPPPLDRSKTFSQSAETPPPALPEEDDSRNIPQPEVRIIRKKDVVIEEYSINGQVRYVKITPASGNPYYMVDTDGDGILETRNDNFANPPINQWILLKW